MPKQALIVIDLQNDYFPVGAFPLWNSENTLSNTEAAIKRAREKHIPIVVVQHIADPAKGRSPFFNQDTWGVAVHSHIVAAAPEAPVVVKRFADSFHQTELENTLARLEVDEILIGGMMTQNCVTHTAISKAAEKYSVKVLADCCTTVTEIVHKLALGALSIRVPVVEFRDVI